MARGTLGTGMMAPLSMANNFNGPYYAGPSGAAMGALMASQAIADGFRDWGESKGRQQEDARVQAERDRARMDELNQRQAVAQAINPMQAAESSGMGNRDMTRRAMLPDAGTQMTIYKMQEDKAAKEQAALDERYSAAATYWYLNGGPQADPDGSNFRRMTGANRSPYEYIKESVYNAAENRDMRRDLAAQADQTRRELAAAVQAGKGGDKTRYSLTQITDPVTGKTNVVAWDPENPTAPPIPVGGAPMKGGGVGGPYDKAQTAIWTADMKAENELLRGAQAKMPVYQEAQTLLDAGLTLDALTPVRMKALGVQAAAGDLTAKEELAKYEAYRSNIYQLALAITSQMKGQQSDKELRFAQDVVGGRMNITDTAAKNILSTYKKSLDNVQNRITAKYKHYESGLPLSEFKYEMPKEAPGLVSPVNATGQGPTVGRRPLETFGKRGM